MKELEMPSYKLDGQRVIKWSDLEVVLSHMEEYYNGYKHFDEYIDIEVAAQINTLTEIRTHFSEPKIEFTSTIQNKVNTSTKIPCEGIDCLKCRACEDEACKGY